MKLERQLLTSKNQTIVIESDDLTTVKHFNNPNNFADIVLNQINTDRLYDEIFKDAEDLVVLDIGGNIGLFSLYLQDRARAIYPIEPTPDHFHILKELTKNYNNIHPVNVALHNENTEIDFYISEENSTMNSSVNQYGIKTPVQARTLETIIKDLNLDRVDFVKCDIEGSEMVALTDETLAPVKDIIDTWFIEVHATQTGLFENRDNIKAIFERAGYEVVYYRPDGLIAHKGE